MREDRRETYEIVHLLGGVVEDAEVMVRERRQLGVGRCCVGLLVGAF